jgi:hypothetical protein
MAQGQRDLLFLEADSTAFEIREAFGAATDRVVVRSVDTVAKAKCVLDGTEPLLAFLSEASVRGEDALDAVEHAHVVRPELPCAIFTAHLRDRDDITPRAFRARALILEKTSPVQLAVEWASSLLDAGGSARLAHLRRAVASFEDEVHTTEFENAQLVAALAVGSDRKATAALMSEVLGRPISVDAVRDARERVVDRFRKAKHLVRDHEAVLALLRRRL